MPAAVSDNGFANSTKAQTSRAYSYLQRMVDWAAPPNYRQYAYDHVSAFAAARPVLFSFLMVQALFSFLPLALFTVFSVSCILFALASAVIFAMFWIGIALMILVPTLLVSSSITALAWAWCVGSFVLARWLYAHAPFAVSGGLHVDAGGNRVSVTKDENGLGGDIEAKQGAQ